MLEDLTNLRNYPRSTGRQIQRGLRYTHRIRKMLTVRGLYPAVDFSLTLRERALDVLTQDVWPSSKYEGPQDASS
jgi:hypothetical protein